MDTSEYEYQEARRQYEGGGVMEPNQDLIIYLSENTVSVAMSVFTTQDKYVSTRSTVENPHPSYKPAADTSSS